MSDTMNAFERRRAADEARTPEFSDDRKNRFERYNEGKKSLAAVRPATPKIAGLPENAKGPWNAKREEANPRTASGVTLDKTTAELKAASDADRAARRGTSAAAISPSAREDADAIWQTWLRKHDFYVTEFNLTNFVNWICTQEALGAIFSVALLDAGARWLKENNYFEAPPPTEPRKRGDMSHTLPPPHVYPHFVSDEEQAEHDADRAAAIAEHNEAERQEALNMNFNNLKALVRAGFKPNPHKVWSGFSGGGL